MRSLGLLFAALLAPSLLWAQSASEIERCFQNPATCSASAPAGAPAGPAASGKAAPAADYAAVLQSPDADRRKIQESLRTLDKYNGPIDGNLQSEATMKAISEWQKGHGHPPVGKLTSAEAQALNAEAAKAPIRRIDPVQTAAVAPAPLSNADQLKALQARLAERRLAAQPKADAAGQALAADLKSFVAADGKGVAGDQFSAFAKWYAENKSAGRTASVLSVATDDYGEVKAGTAAVAEARFETRQGDKIFAQCLIFAWVEGAPRKNTEAFSCDDVAAVEKWKTDQALKSAWR